MENMNINNEYIKKVKELDQSLGLLTSYIQNSFGLEKEDALIELCEKTIKYIVPFYDEVKIVFKKDKEIVSEGINEDSYIFYLDEKNSELITKVILRKEGSSKEERSKALYCKTKIIESCVIYLETVLKKRKMIEDDKNRIIKKQKMWEKSSIAISFVLLSAIVTAVIKNYLHPDVILILFFGLIPCGLILIFSPKGKRVTNNGSD